MDIYLGSYGKLFFYAIRYFLISQAIVFNYSTCYRNLDIYNMTYMRRSHRNIPKYITHMHKENKTFLGHQVFFIHCGIIIIQQQIKSVNVLYHFIHISLQIMIMKTYKTIVCITVMREGKMC